MLTLESYAHVVPCLNCDESIAPGDIVYTLAFAYADEHIELCTLCCAQLRTALATSTPPPPQEAPPW
jgi:hypothetical protein